MTRLDSLLTLLLIMIVIHLSLLADQFVKDYKQAQWESSPLYGLEHTLAKKEALRSAAYNKYDHFKLDCLAFGSDIKLLKAMEAAGHPLEYQEVLKGDLYIKQHTLIERWFLFDALLFPGASDHTTYIYYLQHLKPRRI